VLDLDSSRWSELTHAYGAADDVPELLRELEAVPGSSGDKEEPWFSIWSALAHQGDVYSASFAAVPHVIHVLGTASDRASFDYFQFPAWVEICRQRTNEPVPSDLAEAYFASLAQLPGLIAAAADRPWDEPMVQSALAALAAVKGAVEVAEAAAELTPEVAKEFLEWLQVR
jgi:hypothetical protein